MSLAARLRHHVTIRRSGPKLDGDGHPILDDHRNPEIAWSDVATVAAWVQPRKLRVNYETEVPDGTAQGGAVVSDHTIFMLPTDVTAADIIVHGAQLYAIDGIRDAGGKGHHLEIAAHRVTFAGVPA